jgi:hypothetical protein
VVLADQRSEDYVAPPPPAYVAFSGGKALGKEKSVPVSSEDQNDDSAVCIFSRESLETVVAPVLDESRPTTVLQVKTLAGKKIKMKLVYC